MSLIANKDKWNYMTPQSEVLEIYIANLKQSMKCLNVVNDQTENIVFVSIYNSDSFKDNCTDGKSKIKLLIG